MKGLCKVFLLMFMLMILAVPFASADEQNAIPVEKTVSPGTKVVKFEGVTYRIATRGNYYLTFERVDNEHHRVFILPAPGETAPYCAIYMQWEEFPPVSLGLEMDGATTYLLGVETGYAEK
jgi:hypothetical protein